jgi:uncharacterized protein YunC (DUF1805 family)
MESTLIELENGDVYAYIIEFGNVPLIILEARNGYVMNEYLDIDTANKFGDIAGKVKDAKNLDDFLKCNIVELSNKAKKMRLKKGMTAKEFLNKLFNFK